MNFEEKINDLQGQLNELKKAILNTPLSDFIANMKGEWMYFKERNNSYTWIVKNPKIVDNKSLYDSHGYCFETNYFYLCEDGNVVWGNVELVTNYREATEEEIEILYSNYPHMRPVKVGDYGIAYTDYDTKCLSIKQGNFYITKLLKISNNRYIISNGSTHKNFYRIDLDKLIKPQIDAFLSMK